MSLWTVLVMRSVDTSCRVSCRCHCCSTTARRFSTGCKKYPEIWGEEDVASGSAYVQEDYGPGPSGFAEGGILNSCSQSSMSDAIRSALIMQWRSQLETVYERIQLNYEMSTPQKLKTQGSEDGFRIDTATMAS